MGVYIDLNQALSHPFANGKYDHEHANEHFILGFESYREWLEQLPTIDLVRCGECKWCEEKWDSNNNCPTWECKNWFGGTDYDGYCHEGERRADE